MPSAELTAELLGHLPCALLISDVSGRVLFINKTFSEMTGLSDNGVQELFVDDVFPPAGRIFLQTHVFPLLRREGRVSEISLTLTGPAAKRIGVLLNGSRGAYAGEEAYWWVFMPSMERAKFVTEIIAARNRAQAIATEWAEQKRFLRTITDAVPSLIGYWDRDLRCQFANTAYMQWFVGQPQSVEGKTMLELLGAQRFDERKPYALQALAGNAQVFEQTMTDEDGTRQFKIANYIPDRQPDGSVAGFFALVNDVTSLVEAQSEMHLAAAIVKAAADGIMVIDTQGRIASVNPAFTHITGFSANEAIGRPANFMQTLYAQDTAKQVVGNAAQPRSFGDGEAWCRNKWGDAFVIKQSVSLIPGTKVMPDRSAIVFQDVTARWQQQQLDTHRALHDPLTDLPNRALLMERLGQLIHASARSGRLVALLFLDLDGFKEVNDSLGHDAGDAVLKVIAWRLLKMVRQADTVARLGGDEFVVMLDGPASTDEIASIAKHIIGVVGEPIAYDDQVAHVGTSIGIAVVPHDALGARELLKRADSAMYSAKNAGKNTYRFASTQTP
jgi:diguanylate cyclase (GGDEF)-like protein/PAS domain S-box-containing protein